MSAKRVETHRFDQKKPPPNNLISELRGFFATRFCADFPNHPNELDQIIDFNAIEERLKEGKRLYVAMIRRKVAGLLPSCRYAIETSSAQVPEIEVHCMEWLMTDPKHRDKGIASQLHALFELDTQIIALTEDLNHRPLVQMLITYPGSKAEAIYRHWCYTDPPDEMQRIAKRGIVLVKPIKKVRRI